MSLLRTAEDQAKAPTLSGSANAKLSILVAEDSPVTQDLLRFLLSQRGHQVDVVDDGEKALQALRERRYAIVLMDFHLPKIDGLDVVKRFKSLGEDPKGTRFIGMTGDVEGFMKHPDNWHIFDLVIAKPIDIVHLCGVVENFERYMAWRNREAGGSMTEPTPVMLADEGAQLPRSPAEERRSQRMRIARGMTQITLGNGQIFDC